MKKICGFVGGVLVDRPVHLDTDQDIWVRQSKAFLPVSDNTTHTDLSFLLIQSIVGISGIYWYVLLIFTETTIIWYEAFTKPRIGK